MKPYGLSVHIQCKLRRSDAMATEVGKRPMAARHAGP